MKMMLPIAAMLLAATTAWGQDIVLHDSAVKSVRAEVNGDWSLPPVIMLGSDDVLDISFDRLGHEYRDLTYSIRHYDWDWTESEMLEIDYMDGFSSNDVEDYAPSLNTTVEYTHYAVSLPNDDVQLKLSGNYAAIFSDGDGNEVAEVRFRVLEPLVSVGVEVSSNTLIDNNQSHQQLRVVVNNTGYEVRVPQNELRVVVMQNECPQTAVTLTRPTFIGDGRIEYANTRDLIFAAGNEFRRFEMLNENDVMMGMDDIGWFAPYYHVTLTGDRRRANYHYDEDQDGNYIVRNNDVADSATEADYMLVHFTLDSDRLYDSDVYVYGELTGNRMDDGSRMTYNEEGGRYEKTLLLKQGLYNYRYVTEGGSGRPVTADFEGDFYETENEYSVYVYHRAFGERYDRLVGMSHIYSR